VTVNIGMTIAPRSDQLNADDMIAGPRTIRVTGVKILATPEQPVAISFEGDNGKPFKPGKSMRRVLVKVWGTDGAQYVGRSMTLYRDEGVTFGGVQVGGIRISHMTGIDKPVTMALTATQKVRKPFTVQPLVVDEPDEIDVAALREQATVCAENGVAEYQKFWKSLNNAERSALRADHDQLKIMAKDADEQAAANEPVE
jgi:hypothetical protein